MKICRCVNPVIVLFYLGFLKVLYMNNTLFNSAGTRGFGESIISILVFISVVSILLIPLLFAKRKPAFLMAYLLNSIVSLYLFSGSSLIQETTHSGFRLGAFISGHAAAIFFPLFTDLILASLFYKSLTKNRTVKTVMLPYGDLKYKEIQSSIGRPGDSQAAANEKSDLENGILGLKVMDKRKYL